MTSIFSYKKPSVPVEKPQENKPSIFSYKKPQIEEEIPEEKPKSFTQRVAQELTESEQLEKGIERNIARGTSRILERGLGTPGDIQDFVSSISGTKPTIALPTSKKLKETSEKLSQGYTKAETPFEEKSDEYLQDVASYMLPGGKVKSAGHALARTIGLPLAGALVKEGVSKIGGSEGKQTAAKLGTMLSLDLLTQNPGGITKYIGDFFKRAKNSIPKAATADARNLLGTLNNLGHDISLGGSAAHKTPALTKIEELKKLITQDRSGKHVISAEELPEFRKTINKILDDLNAFSLTTSKEVRSSSIPLLNKVKSAVIDAGNEYGKKNPQFLENWQKGNEAASVYYKSQFIKNFIQKTLGKQFTGSVAKSLFGLGGAGGAIASKIVGPAAIGGLAASGPIQAGKLLYRVIQSPTLRTYYSNVIKEASKGNASQVISNFKALEKKLEEEDKKEKSLIKKYTES